MAALITVIASSSGAVRSSTASASGVTGVQIATLAVAGLAVVATIIAAWLLRRTGKGTVRAAEKAANASEQSADAANKSSQVAVAALVESLSTSVGAPVEDFFLDELVEKREDIRARIRNLSSIKYQLGVLMVTVNRDGWNADLGESIAPTHLILPTIDVATVHSEMMAKALVEHLSKLAAFTSMFEVAKRADDRAACWKVLRNIERECRSAREVINKSLEGHYKSEATVTSDMHQTRNTIGAWRRGRRDRLMTYLGEPELAGPPAIEDADSE